MEGTATTLNVVSPPIIKSELPFRTVGGTARFYQERTFAQRRRPVSDDNS